MQNLTPQGQQIVSDVASRYGVSTDAVSTLLSAINAGYGTQAQFNHFELGGMGQWSQGGMIMIGDMFNNGLKNMVSNMCNELSQALANNQMYQPAPQPAPFQPQSSQSQSQSNGFGSSFSTSGGMQGGSSWPAELGQPSSSGSQNNLRYAVFPSTRRLAIDNNGTVTVYDIGDHNIGGFSQQQGGDQSITFTSQYGLVRVADLPVVTLGQGKTEPAPQQQPVQQQPEPQQPAPQNPAAAPSNGGNSDEIFGLIEKLSSLHANGILTQAEYETKKAELLGRL
ncbi:SHOCT domain-containing protein [Pseudoruegeria sp. SK021]|uniref:SHOCT domain-containing protein n=1 Tax=Pseudoruegeria sp. SK021 TaxID=1933035 RepID=UPI000A239F81|nr:SHOCT domain-containing protein [Pseudoruegeria sp. SK021]OSP55732.1 hypothetical protein BV911_06405 [Pseudoruegeria sp. SK021]